MDEKREEVSRILKAHTLSQTWLLHRLQEHDLYIDKSLLSNVLAGVRQGNKAEQILDASLLILRSYDKWARVCS